MRAYMGHYFPIRKQIESLDLSPYYVHIVGFCRMNQGCAASIIGVLPIRQAVDLPKSMTCLMVKGGAV